jgi:hypothetical protein
LAVAALLVGFAACGNDGPSGVDGDVTCESAHAESDPITGLTTRTATGTLSATIDGQAWSAGEDICVSSGVSFDQATLHVFGYDDRVRGTNFAGSEALTISFGAGDVPLGPGEYALDSESSVAFGWGTLVGALQWYASGGGDLEDGAAGTATITTFSANRISGTFAFIGLPNGHDSPNVVVTNGSFDLTY